LKSSKKVCDNKQDVAMPTDLHQVMASRHPIAPRTLLYRSFGEAGRAAAHSSGCESQQAELLRFPRYERILAGFQVSTRVGVSLGGAYKCSNELIIPGTGSVHDRV
jgi:hypothetical protein